MTYKIRYTMTYKKFKQKVEELGLGYNCYGYGIGFRTFLLDGKGDRFLIVLSKHNQFVNPYFNPKLSESIKNKVIDLCFELTKTPINERGKRSDLWKI